MRIAPFAAAVVLGLCATPAGAQQPPGPDPSPYPYPYPYPAYPTQGPPPPPQQQQQQQQQQQNVPPPPAPGSPGYYYPPPGWAAPIYSYPPPPAQQPPPVYRGHPAPRQGAACNGNCPGHRGVAMQAQASPPPADRARYVSIGLRLTALSINQSIGDKGTTLGGAGAEVRFRSRGRFGIEASLDSLHGEFEQGGTITRDTVPFQLSMLIYLFPNADSRHFNLYFLGGGGVSSTKMQLIDPTGNAVSQQFREWDLHLGVGMELRFKWLALRADARGLRLWRDDSGDGQWYGSIDGAPVPTKSFGAQGTVGAALWF